jgi:tape measure domain-containing protein
VADSELRFRVTGDAGGASRAFRAIGQSLQTVKKEATSAKAALAGIKSSKASVTMDTKAIAKARAEINRLRDEVAKKHEADVTADTRQAERRIKQLESSIKSLSKTNITPDVKVSGLARLKSGIAGLATGVSKFGAGAADAFKAIGVPVLGSIGVALAGVTAGVTALGIKSVGLADQLEQSKIAFTQFLGSAEKSDKFLSGLRGFAAQTPFEFPELVEASKKLLAFNVAGKQVIPIMRTFGDVAALTGSDVNDLVTIYGQMFAKGKVANEELMQFTERGVPAYQILSDKLGLSVDKIQKLASEGKLGAAALKQLQVGLDEKFGGGMAKQAQTLSGMISTLKDTMAGTLTDIGDAVLPLAKSVFPAIQKGAENLGSKIKTMMPTIVDVLAGGMQGLLTVPSTLLTALAGVAQGFAGMVSSIQTSLSSLVMGIADALASLPRAFGDIDTSGLESAALGLAQASIETNRMGKEGFDKLTQAAADADTKLKPVADSIERARQAAQGQIKLDLQTQQVDTKIAAATAKIDKLKNQKKHVTLDADKKYFDKKIEAAEKDLARLKDKKSTIKVDAKIDTLRAKVVEAKGKLAELKKQKTTPEVTAKINQLEAKVKAGKARLAELNKQRPKPRSDLNNASLNAAAKAATAKVNALDKKKATPGVGLKWAGMTPSESQTAINRIHGKTVTVNIRTHKSKGTTADIGPQPGLASLLGPTAFETAAMSGRAFASALPRASSRAGSLDSALSAAGLIFGDSSIDIGGAAPTITIVTRDAALANFIDVRVDGKAARATRVVQRKEVLQL